ncbi:hypothetical protein IAR55_003305 [Kwoniella newhampshirensis]|uniref:Chromo domain-containing protein n=1 Tax=Kwoniella newhampshirensis TaxID=1651941 RepID=A0AAW0YYU4_9TREE
MPAASSSRAKSKSVEEKEEPIDVDEQVEDGDGDEDDEEDGEGEYEVEAIVDHRQKGTGSGKFEYLVSWKGYGPEHNTWEPEAHVAHADGIVSTYWANRPKPSLQKDTKKRAQPSASGSAPPSQRAAKASRTSVANGKRKTIPVEDSEEEAPEYEDTHVDSTEKYKEIIDWEEVVAGIDTIERNSKDELMIYVTMSGGERVGLPTEVAYKRCPQKILKFYESHLKWKRTD